MEGSIASQPLQTLAMIEELSLSKVQRPLQSSSQNPSSSIDPGIAYQNREPDLPLAGDEIFQQAHDIPSTSTAVQLFFLYCTLHHLQLVSDLNHLGSSPCKKMAAMRAVSADFCLSFSCSRADHAIPPFHQVVKCMSLSIGRVFIRI